MSELEIEGVNTFFYYNDLPAATKFYAEKLGFKLVMKLDWLSIFQIKDTGHLGLVDKTMGSHPPSKDKPVRLQLWVKDTEVWYKHLKENGLDPKAIYTGKILHIKTTTIQDPEGYTVEFCQWLTKWGL